MSDYTPSTEQVRAAYVIDGTRLTHESRRIGFDRWLAEHDAAIWDEGCAFGWPANAMTPLHEHTKYNPYRQPPEPVVDPDVCPVCGHHNLTNGEYAMSHEQFVEFSEWAKRQPYARDHQRENARHESED